MSTYLLTLCQANSAFEIQSKLSNPDATLFAQALRGEENKIAQYLSTAYSRETCDLDELNALMAGADFLVTQHPLCAEIRNTDQAL